MGGVFGRASSLGCCVKRNYLLPLFLYLDPESPDIRRCDRAFFIIGTGGGRTDTVSAHPLPSDCQRFIWYVSQESCSTPSEGIMLILMFRTLYLSRGTKGIAVMHQW